jgi:glycosyltransferase involved in cell wall biosynthesis
MDKIDYQIEFSVIICCYNEDKCIDEFCQKLSEAMNSLGRTYEIVLVNDGSTDKTFGKLRSFYDSDPNVTTLVDLFRNSGQLAATTAGVVHARGKHYIIMDSDLQLDPKEISILLEEFDKGCDIVSGCRTHRKDKIARIIFSRIANQIVKKVSGHNITDIGCTFKIYNGKLIRGFELGAFKQFLTAYIYSKAGTVKEIPVSHFPRKYGTSGWTFKQLLSYNMDNLVGISRRPFQFLSIACAVAAMIFFLRIITGLFIPFTIIKEPTLGLVLNSLAFVILILLSVLAVIGEYVIRNFIILRGYPIYIIRDLFQKNKTEDTDPSA